MVKIFFRAKRNDMLLPKRRAVGNGYIIGYVGMYNSDRGTFFICPCGRAVAWFAVTTTTMKQKNTIDSYSNEECTMQFANFDFIYQ